MCLRARGGGGGGGGGRAHGWVAEQLHSEEYSNVNSVPRYFFTSSI